MSATPSPPPEPAATSPVERAYGKLTLIGSGEFLEAMAKVHRSLLEPYGDKVNAVFLDTPAGFELNCDDIAERAIQYFAQRFDVALAVASFRSQRATPLEISAALRRLAAAEYIVAGPGSPTYAIRTWRGSPVWDMVVNRFRNGAHVVLASAAAMSIGRRAVPIYEIYRCGEDPTWVDGLDLLGPLGFDVAVMPHWNNSSGTNHDTRFCFMGGVRRAALQALLPPTAVVLGIDEHTALTIDFKEQRCRVEGAGGATVMRHDSETVYESGAEFALAELASETHPGLTRTFEVPARVVNSDSSRRPVLARYLTELAAALEAEPDSEAHTELIDWIHDATHELAGEPLHAEAKPALDGALIELLGKARQELRAAKRFEASDEIRDRLAALGIQPAADRPVGG